MILEQISALIRNVPDFPKPGILFKDITPLLADGEAFIALAKLMSERVDSSTTKLVAVESRGFILAAAMAQHLGTGVVLVRKPGKLPSRTHEVEYQLEYGSDRLQIHVDALDKSDCVTIVDDVLATGGTAKAVEDLCRPSGAKVLGHVFLMEIAALQGHKRLAFPYQSLFEV